MGLREGIGLKFSFHPKPGSYLTLTAFIIIGASMAWMSLDSIIHDHRSVLLIAAPICTLVAFGLLCAELTARSRKLSQLASALSESEARFRDFAVTASDWFWETDQELRFSYTSDTIRVFGQDPDTRIGRTRIELAADVETEPDKWREHLAVLSRREPFRDFVYRRRLGEQPEQTPLGKRAARVRRREPISRIPRHRA